ncbi:molybdopterin molybdotransferase MoeA [Pelagibacterales bacterium SAG-MED09]|nr:molybdopterin molybdotransferase MoeA [Pelagibacterales bacterium SAG-MED09]
MINYKQAKNIFKKAKIRIQDEEILVRNSLNRVVAKDIISPSNHPLCDNAAFDGFAINFNDTKNLNRKNLKQFRILGSIAAGNKPFNKKVKKFDTIEVMTGGIISKPFNTIIPIEQINFYPDKQNPKSIIIDHKISKNNHVRFKGSDYKKGKLIVKKGTIIQPNHILALKTLGVQKIKVKKKLNIIFFSTGNEISNSNRIPNWKVRNSNSNYIENLNENFLFNFKNGGILRDNHQNLFKSKIKKILKSKIDIIITSGAVSAGKFDYIPSVIKKFKNSHYFKSVMIRPGKPILFAKIKQKIIFGLPGNPISSAACFRFFVYPYIENILNLSPEKPIKAILKNNFEKKKFLTRFIKSKLITTKNGKLEVKLLPGQESFRINSFVKSNIWAVLPQGQTKFKKGQIIDCFLPNSPNKILD